MLELATAEIQNVVLSSSIEREIELEKVTEDLPGSVYDPDRFPGLVYRVQDPKAAILLFRTGKLVCTGPDSEERGRDVIRNFFATLADLGIEVPDDPTTVVVNVVGSCDLGSPLDLRAVAMGLGLNHIEYEPEQFPGLVYRVEDLGVVVLLFGSGKVVVTGASSPEQVVDAVRTVSDELSDAGLL